MSTIKNGTQVELINSYKLGAVSVAEWKDSNYPSNTTWFTVSKVYKDNNNNWKNSNNLYLQDLLVVKELINKIVDEKSFNIRRPNNSNNSNNNIAFKPNSSSAEMVKKPVIKDITPEPFHKLDMSDGIEEAPF